MGAGSIEVPCQRIGAARGTEGHSCRTAVCHRLGVQVIIIHIRCSHCRGHIGETAAGAHRAEVVGRRAVDARSVARACGHVGAARAREGVGRILGREPVDCSVGSGIQRHHTRAAAVVARGAKGRNCLVGHRHRGGLAFAAVHLVGGRVGGAAAGNADIIIRHDGAVALPCQRVCAVGGGQRGTAAASIDRGGQCGCGNLIADGHIHRGSRALAAVGLGRHVVSGILAHRHVNRGARVRRSDEGCVGIPGVGHIAVRVVHRQGGLAGSAERHRGSSRSGRGRRHRDRHLFALALGGGVVGGHIIGARGIGHIVCHWRRCARRARAPAQSITVLARSGLQGHVARALAVGRLARSRNARHRIHRHGHRGRVLTAIGMRTGHRVGRGIRSRRHRDGGACLVGAPYIGVGTTGRQSRGGARTVCAVGGRGRHVRQVFQCGHSRGHLGETAAGAHRAEVVGRRAVDARSVARACGHVGAARAREGVGRILGREPVDCSVGSGIQRHHTRAAAVVARGAKGRNCLVGHRHRGGLAFAAVHLVGGRVGGAAAGNADIIIRHDGAVALPCQRVCAVGGGQRGTAAASIDRGGQCGCGNLIADGHIHRGSRALAAVGLGRHVVSGILAHRHVNRGARVRRSDEGCVGIPGVGHIAVRVVHRQGGLAGSAERHRGSSRSGRGRRHRDRHLFALALGGGVVGGHIIGARGIGHIVCHWRRCARRARAPAQSITVLARSGLQGHVARALAVGRLARSRNARHRIHRHGHRGRVLTAIGMRTGHRVGRRIGSRGHRDGGVRPAVAPAVGIGTTGRQGRGGARTDCIVSGRGSGRHVGKCVHRGRHGHTRRLTACRIAHRSVVGSGIVGIKGIGSARSRFTQSGLRCVPDNCALGRRGTHHHLAGTAEGIRRDNRSSRGGRLRHRHRIGAGTAVIGTRYRIGAAGRNGDSGIGAEIVGPLVSSVHQVRGGRQCRRSALADGSRCDRRVVDAYIHIWGRVDRQMVGGCSSTTMDIGTRNGVVAGIGHGRLDSRVSAEVVGPHIGGGAGGRQGDGIGATGGGGTVG